MFDKTTTFNPRIRTEWPRTRCMVSANRTNYPPKLTWPSKRFTSLQKTQPTIYMRSQNTSGRVVSSRQVELAFKCDESQVPIPNTMKLLGVTIDDKLNFENHVAKICRKVSQQITVLIKGSIFQLMND